MKKSVLSLIGSIAGIIVCVLCIPIIIVNAVLIVRAYAYPNDIPSAFGVKPMICLSGSMSPLFEAGDMVFVKNVDVNTLKVDDVVCFIKNGTAITHRTIELSTDENGKVSYVTKGDANNVKDSEVVYQEEIQGLYTGVNIPEMGNFAVFMQTTNGMILFVVCPLLVLIAYNIIRQKIASKEERKRMMELQMELLKMKGKEATK